MGKAYIGTSGFSYPHWGKGVFYPKGLPQNQWLSFYAQHFNTVELNVSFYRLPKKETFEKWAKTVATPEVEGSRVRLGEKPRGCLKREFVFAVKGWRWITHIKKLKNCEEELGMFFEAVSGLRVSEVARHKFSRLQFFGRSTAVLKEESSAPKSGASKIWPGSPWAVILWQLPPSLRADLSRLESFLALLPADYRHAFEFRHQSWLDQDVFSVLSKGKLAIVFQDYPEWPQPQKVWPKGGITGDFVYLRFHGKKALYTSGYSHEELARWGRRIKKWLKNDLDVYAYFNNDALGYAVENAKELIANVNE